MINSSPKTFFYSFGGSGQTGGVRFLGKLLLLLSIGLLADITNVCAQMDDDSDTAPPPLKMISRPDRDLLDRQRNVKDRTKTALTLMENRIKAAAQFNSSDELDKVFSELGVFHALMDDTLQYLENSDSKRGRVLDNFKRFEIGLRRFTPQLELIRREMPMSHEFYVRSLLRQLRDARTKATEPMFGDTVIREG